MTFRDYLDIVWRRKFVVLLIIGLGLLATLFVRTSEATTTGDFSGELTLAMNEGENFSDLLLFEQVALRTNTITSRVAAVLGEDYFGNTDTAEAISSITDVRADPTVGTIQLTIGGLSSAEQVDEILLAYSQELMNYATERRVSARDDQLASLERRETSILRRIDELDRELEQLASEQEEGSSVDPSRVTTAQLGSNLASLTEVQEEIAILTDQAEADLVPLTRIGTPSIVDDTREVSPLSFNQRVLIGLALSTVLGIGLAIGLQRFDTRIFTRKDAETAFGLPVLAEIPKIRWWARRHPSLYTRQNPTSKVAVGFRLLRSGLAHARATQLERLGGAQPSRGSIVLVTSVAHETGKTTTVANLAVAAVDAEMSVLVVDADLRDPALHEYFDVEASVGITDAVRGRIRTGQTSLDPFVVRTRAAGVSLLTHGETVPNPGELLAQIQPLLELATREFDLVLLDTPPMLAGNDVSELIPFADLVLLAARAGQTTIDEAHWAEETASRLDAPLCGVVLIGARPQLAARRDSLLRKVARRVLNTIVPSRRARRRSLPKVAGRTDGNDFVQPALFDPPTHKRGADGGVAASTETRIPTPRVSPPEGSAAEKPPSDIHDTAVIEAVPAILQPNTLRPDASEPLGAQADPLPASATRDGQPSTDNLSPSTGQAGSIPLPPAPMTEAAEREPGNEFDLDAGLVDERMTENRGNGIIRHHPRSH